MPWNPELVLDPVIADSIRADGHLADLLSVASYGGGCLYIYIYQNAFPNHSHPCFSYFTIMARTLRLSDGKPIPSLAWGSGSGGINKEQQLVIDMGIHALKCGIRHIDTAQIYGTEGATGESFRASGLKREDVWITTKGTYSRMHQERLD